MLLGWKASIYSGLDCETPIRCWAAIPTFILRTPDKKPTIRKLISCLQFHIHKHWPSKGTIVNIKESLHWEHDLDFWQKPVDNPKQCVPSLQTSLSEDLERIGLLLLSFFPYVKVANTSPTTLLHFQTSLSYLTLRPRMAKGPPVGWETENPKLKKK